MILFLAPVLGAGVLLATRGGDPVVRFSAIASAVVCTAIAAVATALRKKGPQR
jgi:hypothetical protein